MHHHLEVSLSPRKPRAPLFECKKRSIGIRLWHRLFGRSRIVILFPGESVDTVTVIERPPGAVAGGEQ